MHGRTLGESVRGRWRPFVGVLVGVGACTGPVTYRIEPSSSSDGPPDAAPPDAKGSVVGPPRAGESQHHPNSGIGPAALQGLGLDASIALDAASESGLPPRLDGDGPWSDAVPAGMPQVIDRGGPVVSAPVFQPITFANYNLTSAVDDFVARVGASSYWRQVVSQYGIGTASAAAPVHLAFAAPGNIDDVQLQVWLAAEITSGTFAPLAANMVYVLFYPVTSSVTFNGAQSCFNMGAYHNSTVVGGASVPYVVVPECTWSSRSAQQETTAAASHEMIESVTDPLPLSATPAYLGTDLQHLVFPLVLGGEEVADLCAQWPSSFFVPEDLPYMVQRAWSNSAVAAGRDPCAPELPGETFFNAVPAQTDSVEISDGTENHSTLGTRIAVGASRVIDVHLYSEADVGPWTVQAVNVPTSSSNLDFAWDRATGGNGDTLHLTVTVAAVDETYGGDPFLLESTLGGETNYWIGYVAQ